jgi:hypothetical protein
MFCGRFLLEGLNRGGPEPFRGSLPLWRAPFMIASRIMRGECLHEFFFFMTTAGSVEKSMPGNPHNAYADPSGGGKFLAVLKFEKKARRMRDGSVRPCRLPLPPIRSFPDIRNRGVPEGRIAGSHPYFLVEKMKSMGFPACTFSA